MMNKRGEESGNFLNRIISLVIAALLIALFAYAVVQLYYLNVDDERKGVIALLNSVEGKIDNLETGESNFFTFQGVRDWFLVGFNGTTSLEFKPEACTLGSCICVCEGSLDSYWIDDRYRKEVKELCESNGICRDVSSAEALVRTIYADGNVPHIYFGANQLYAINITKGEESLELNQRIVANLSELYGDDSQIVGDHG